MYLCRGAVIIIVFFDPSIWPRPVGSQALDRLFAEVWERKTSKLISLSGSVVLDVHCTLAIEVTSVVFAY